MLTDGTVVRLGKEDFQTLLNEPMLHWVDQQEAERVVAGGGRWLDVRLPSELENFHIEGAANIPLYFLVGAQVVERVPRPRVSPLST